MTLRKFLFWCHLAAGVSAGIVIFIMSVTGALLTYERQIIAWADTRQYRAAPSAGASRLPMEAIIVISIIEKDDRAGMEPGGAHGRREEAR